MFGQTQNNASLIALVIVLVKKLYFTEDCFVSDEKLEGTGQRGHRSFLHSSPQWQRELLLNNNNSSNSNVRLTSVSHRREDSDDIRSDTSSDNIAEDNDDDSDDTNNSGPSQTPLHISQCQLISFL